jgi:hypothetical protein
MRSNECGRQAKKKSPAPALKTPVNERSRGEECATASQRRACHALLSLLSACTCAGRSVAWVIACKRLVAGACMQDVRVQLCVHPADESADGLALEKNQGHVREPDVSSPRVALNPQRRFRASNCPAPATLRPPGLRHVALVSSPRPDLASTGERRP